MTGKHREVRKSLFTVNQMVSGQYWVNFIMTESMVENIHKNLQPENKMAYVFMIVT